MPTPPAYALFATLSLALFGASSAKERPPRPSKFPVTGKAVPQLAALDKAMLDFMRARDIRVGTLCVARDETVVFERGYGWLDAEMKKPLSPDAPMRIASLSKPITAAAVDKLIADGKLDADEKVFALLKIKPHGEPDPRLAKVTVEDLLEHRGGWDREKSGDPVFKARLIASQLGVPSPPNQKQLAAWVFGKPLDFAPGTRKAYSNFGYLLLGLVIEEVTGQDATAWIREHIMAGCEEFAIARSLPVDRDPREPPYYDPAPPSPSVFGDHHPVPAPDGTWPNELMEAHGGWRISARGYTEFLTRYWIGGAPRPAGARGFNFRFFGSLPGTWTVARQRWDGVSFTVLFNQRKDTSGKSYEAILKELDTAIDEIQKPGG